MVHVRVAFLRTVAGVNIAPTNQNLAEEAFKSSAAYLGDAKCSKWIMVVLYCSIL